MIYAKQIHGCIINVGVSFAKLMKNQKVSNIIIEYIKQNKQKIKGNTITI